MKVFHRGLCPVCELLRGICSGSHALYALGVAQQTIDLFIDEELDKRTFIEIVIKQILQKELSELKPRALHQRAKDAGALWCVLLKAWRGGA